MSSYPHHLDTLVACVVLLPVFIVMSTSLISNVACNGDIDALDVKFVINANIWYTYLSVD